MADQDQPNLLNANKGEAPIAPLTDPSTGYFTFCGFELSRYTLYFAVILVLVVVGYFVWTKYMNKCSVLNESDNDDEDNESESDSDKKKKKKTKKEE